MTVMTISRAGLEIAMSAAGAMAQGCPDKPATLIVRYDVVGPINTLARKAAGAISAEIDQPGCFPRSCR